MMEDRPWLWAVIVLILTWGSFLAGAFWQRSNDDRIVATYQEYVKATNELNKIVMERNAIK